MGGGGLGCLGSTVEGFRKRLLDGTSDVEPNFGGLVLRVVMLDRCGFRVLCVAVTKQSRARSVVLWLKDLEPGSVVEGFED